MDSVFRLDVDQMRSVYAPLTTAVRRLVDVTIRTTANAASVAQATTQIECATEELSRSLIEGSIGVQQATDGANIAWGNVVIGLRNPVAPPLVIHHGTDSRVWSDFVLGAAYEGPAGHVHGGICALVLDHVLGATAHLPGKPAYTGTLTLRYLRPTPLGRPLRAEAHVDRIDGVKTFVVGHLADDEGITVKAEGIFIHGRES